MKLPQFATDFGHVVLACMDELAVARETAPTGQPVAVYRRATAKEAGLAAILVVGSPDAIDRFQQEHDL